MLRFSPIRGFTPHSLVQAPFEGKGGQALSLLEDKRLSPTAGDLVLEDIKL